MLVLCLTRVPPVPCRGLFGNQLSGTIPNSLGNATNLNILYVIGVLGGAGCMGEYVHVCMSVWAVGVCGCPVVWVYGCMDS